VTVTCLPTTTLGSVLVRCDAGVEGKNIQRVAKGSQETINIKIGVFPSSSGEAYERPYEWYSGGNGLQHVGNGYSRRHMCFGIEFS
jgi:hypothetical protein